jgi:hypothetical protein
MENTRLQTFGSSRFDDSTSRKNAEAIIEENKIKIKNETYIKTFLNEIWPTRDNYELENWIYFIFILTSVFILSVPFCLIAKYFIEEKRRG